MSQLLPLTPWHWWALAGGLLLVEAFAPGFVFMWLGIAAVVTGGLFWLAPWLGWQLQTLVFAALCILSVLAWTRFRARHPEVTDEPMLNQRGQEHVGQRFVLTEAIAQGRGRARVGDGSWPVTGPDLPAGAVVRVVSLDGSRLVVEPAEADG